MKKKSWTMTTVIGIVLAMAAGAAQGKVALSANGKSLGVIVHNGNTAVAPIVATARDAQSIKGPAETLQAYLKEITGAEMPMVETVAEAGERPAIILELVKHVPGASKRATGSQAYRITTKGNNLILTAETPLGLHNAVYGLLEDHLGCRFYTFRSKGMGYAGRGYEVVPKQPTLALDAINDLQEPAFANRGIIFWMGSYPWILQNRGVGTPSGNTSAALGAGHTLYQLIPPTDKKSGNKIIKGLFADHPEIYSLNEAGQREHTWGMGICGTNEELPKFIAAGLEREIARRLEHSKGKVDWSMPFPAGQGDGFNACYCEKCRKLVHDEQSEAAPFILALNRAVEIVNKKYPKARVITFAYFGTIDAPRKLKPNKNLWVNVVSSDQGANAAGDQMGSITNNPANRDYARALKEWPKLAPDRVTVWHWDTYRAEWPSMFYVDDNMRYFRDCKLFGVNPQFCGGPWTDMLAWLYLKLAWNPDLDGDALIHQYCDDNYGKEAGAHVWEYLKLAQSGYEDNLYVPSAVRWSGWTPTMRVKMFSPVLLEKMTTAMDKAQAAAEKAGDKVRLANLLGARGQSLDVVTLDDVAYSGKPWGPVRNKADGKDWYVAGGDPRVPPALMRAKQGIVTGGGGEMGVLRTITTYSGNNGGPLVKLEGKTMTASVCPDLKGQMTSAVDRKSGTELLVSQGTQGGYVDVFGRISAQMWLPVAENHDVGPRANDDWSTIWSDFKNQTPNSLQTDVVLSPPHYGFNPYQYVRRTVTATDQGVKIERQFIQEKAQGLANPSRFTTQWRLAMPNSKVSKVAVKGGGIDQLLDLSYAVPGGITTVKAGEKMKGADYFDERFDTVIAVSAAEATKLPVKADAGGDVTITFDRGDGTAAVLTTDVAGWEAIEIKPILEKNMLEITLVGVPVPMDAEPKTLDLPAQTLSAKAASVVKDLSDHKDQVVPVVTVAPKVRKTGDTSGVNEIDGAELVWIPAGEFLCGSEKYADEKPAKKVYLDGYWVYKYPVTVGQYKKFCTATGTEFKPMWGQGMKAGVKGQEDDYAVQLNWYEADAYAKWAGAGLPTEAQWEKASRGSDGREFPWGKDWDADKCVSNAKTVGQFTPGFMPVTDKQQSVSPYGVVATAGNVWEWVGDWYGHDYYQIAPDKNPAGPETGSHKVIRGGCSLYDERFSRTAARMIQPPQVRDWTPIGFRCVIQQELD